jgi:predicted RNA binding protein YcfA (HicA-like mRNA interferase family)
MSKRKKLLEKLRNNPKGVTSFELTTLLEQHRFSLNRVTGSHHVFQSPSRQTLVIPVHNNKVSPTYVKIAIAAIDSEPPDVDVDQEDDDDD